MTSPGYELEQQRLQSIGQTPPVSFQPMAQPGPTKIDTTSPVTPDPALMVGLVR